MPHTHLDALVSKENNKTHDIISKAVVTNVRLDPALNGKWKDWFQTELTHSYIHRFAMKAESRRPGIDIRATQTPSGFLARGP